jgi:hypothetical protein
MYAQLKHFLLIMPTFVFRRVATQCETEVRRREGVAREFFYMRRTLERVKEIVKGRKTLNFHQIMILVKNFLLSKQFF